MMQKTGNRPAAHPQDKFVSVASGVRLRVLIPLTVAIILLVGTFVSLFVREVEHRQSEDIARAAKSVEESLQTEMAEGVQVMSSVMQLIMRDQRLAAALRAGDRETLLEISEPILKDVKARIHITHFYYILPDRTMLLRVQVPDQWGDRIDRFVLQEAQRTGKPYWGNEQGPFGSLTLRVVYPWLSDGKIIGYFEMGIEFEDLMQTVHKLLDVDVFVAIDKKFLNRQKWDQMQKKKGNDVNWDEFPSAIVLSRTSKVIPAPINTYLGTLKEKHVKRAFEATWDGRVFQTIVVPFADIRGRELGELVVLRDVTVAAFDARQAVVLTAVVGTLIGGMLLILFYVLLGRVQRDVAERTSRLAEAQRVLGAEQTERQRAERERDLQQERITLLEIQNRMVQDLAVAKERAEIANQAKSTFLASMSHELRTPLNAVLGYAQILKRDKGLSERQMAGLNTIQQSGEHLLTLITDLLDLAKIESGKFDLHPDAVNLAFFLQLIGDMIRVKTEQKGLLFSLAIAADLPPTVLFDEKRLRQILLNLLVLLCHKVRRSPQRAETAGTALQALNEGGRQGDS